jgi:hypothetical protein
MRSPVPMPLPDEIGKHTPRSGDERVALWRIAHF